eukprot:235335-Prymnesium_polylepis.1
MAFASADGDGSAMTPRWRGGRWHTPPRWTTDTCGSSHASRGTARRFCAAAARARRPIDSTAS